MTMADPLLPHPGNDETIAAADPGAGAPEPAEGFGVQGEEPDRTSAEPEADREVGDLGDTPFRTPVPPVR